MLRVILNRPGCYGRIDSDRIVDLIGEICYRILSLYEQDWAHKYVCSHRFLAGTQRRDAFAPLVDKLEKFIPEDHRIYPQDDLEEVILSSMKRLVCTPDEVFFNILKNLYYKEIFLGRDPVEIPRMGPPESKRGHTDSGELFSRVRGIMKQFLIRWTNPGFTYRDKEKFFVRTTFAVDSLSLQAGNEDVRMLDVQGREFYLNSLLHFLRTEGKLPDWMSARLGQYFESDILVKHKIRQTIRDLESRGERAVALVIVTADLRLCAEAIELMKRSSIFGFILAVEPLIYLLGRYGEVEAIFNGMTIVIEDQGAITWCDRRYFNDGFPQQDSWFDSPWEWRMTRYERVIRAKLIR